jgi:GntR family transcriptional regulator, transcriptional repressor for pyruvate dehydrogenase complex
MQFPKIKPERLSDAIVRQIETLILDGVLRPGERLPSERELAQELEVSRPSLREALQKLESVGLLETRHGGGTYVKNAIAAALTDPLLEVFQRHPEAALDFIELRNTLDGICAYYAALRSTEEDRQILAERFRTMEAVHQLEDPTEEAERDADFHIAIAEASHNIALLHVMRGLMDLLRKDILYNRMQLYKHAGARDVLLRHHREIFDAIMSGNPDAARTAAQTHMTHVDRVLRERTLSDARGDVSRRRLARYLAETNGPADSTPRS